MKKIAVLMNTNEVGGAERSLVFQMKNQPESHLTFFLPALSKSTALENFLKSEGFSDIKYYDYPSSLYSISRSRINFKLNIFKDIFKLIFSAGSLKELNQYNMVYLNGNKAAFLFFIKNRMFQFKGKVVWHLRDYYHSSVLTNAVFGLLSKDIPQLSFVCNSFSVKKSLSASPWRTYPVDVIYNPVGQILNARDTARTINTIGFVSMMAPWKGVHEIVLWSKLFENELRDLGVTNIKIYGGEIYKTDGDHKEYTAQIKRLNKKFKTDLLSFEGQKDPKDIFQEIDCLIHYSLSPEPFGRVIIEAFDAGIPVISTCLGGAAELVQSQITGIKVQPHDRRGLFMAVEQLVHNKVKTFKLIQGGFEKAKLIQSNISPGMKKVLDIGEAS